MTSTDGGGGRVDGGGGADGAIPGMDAAMDSGECEPLAHGSCRMGDTCLAFLGSYWASDDPRSSCPTGEYSECGCPTDGLYGRCLIFSGLLNEQEEFYYSGDPAMLEASCDGVWTPGTVVPTDGGPTDGGTADAQVDCGALTAPENGAVAAPSTSGGATATYSCDAGFTLSGAAARTCQASGEWSGSAPTCVEDCPCFDDADLATIEADPGTRTCLVDSMGGGTTQTLLMRSGPGTYRFVAEALESDFIPGSHLGCGYGCLDSGCGTRPAHATMDDISVAAHATCRALIVARCPP